MPGQRVCKDCGVVTKRGLNYPGPRCRSHHLLVTKQRKAVKHEAHVQKTFSLRPGEYTKLLEAQGGRCAALGCRARGLARRLATDHDHKLEGRASIRGLLCSNHNHQLFGRFGDDPEFYDWAAAYLRTMPAQKVLEA